MVSYEQTVAVLLGVECILYLLIIAVTLKRGDLQEQAPRVLIFYAVTLCLWVLGELLWRRGWLAFLGVNTFVMARMPAYGALVTAGLFLLLTRAFLYLEGRGRGWWILGAVLVVALVVLDNNLLGLPQVLWTGYGWTIPRQVLGLGVLILGWAAFMGGAVVLTGKTYHQRQQPLHRNRITYWPLALVSTIAGGVLFLSRLEMLGGGFHLLLLGTLSAAYVVLTHHLPDVRQMARRVMSYLIITFLAVALYTVGLVAVQYFFQTMPGYNPTLAGAAMAILIAIIFDPLLGLVQRLVTRVISRAGYDPGHMLREYGMAISNILDLEYLSTVALGLISEALEIRRGVLFVVDEQEDQEGKKVENYRLQAVPGLGEDPPPGILSAKNPVADYLRWESQPLTQYDIDLLPRFRGVSEAERAWFSGLDMDVYVPIHTERKWIGLLALGPKNSGDRYFDDDLTLLGNLADRTSVALENARLVENLTRTNKDLRQAYGALNRANRQLQELDRLKSAFIGVITHELRTPFANVVFSLELIERHGRPELRDQLAQLTTGIKEARKMVDNLVTFATLLSKQGELRPAWLDFSQVIRDSLLPLQSLARSKQIPIHTDIPTEMPPLYGDRDRLSEAVYHLIHNAIKFTEPGGQVWVRCQATSELVGFEVQDTGVGVPADKLPALWEGFTQIADSLRRGVEGLGLGLALVRYVVGAHGGEVWAQSEVGVGSRFGFYVPLIAPRKTDLDHPQFEDAQEKPTGEGTLETTLRDAQARLL